MVSGHSARYALRSEPLRCRLRAEVSQPIHSRVPSPTARRRRDSHKQLSGNVEMVVRLKVVHYGDAMVFPSVYVFEDSIRTVDIGM